MDNLPPIPLRLLDTGEFSDISIIVEEKVYLLHKAILANASDVFRTRFFGSNEWNTRTIDKQSTEEWKGLENMGGTKEWERILRFWYGSSLAIDHTNLAQLLTLADYFISPPLHKAVEGVIGAKVLDSDQVLGISCPRTRQSVLHLTRDQFLSLVQMMVDVGETPIPKAEEAIALYLIGQFSASGASIETDTNTNSSCSCTVAPTSLESLVSDSRESTALVNTSPSSCGGAEQCEAFHYELDNVWQMLNTFAHAGRRRGLEISLDRSIELLLVLSAYLDDHIRTETQLGEARLSSSSSPPLFPLLKASSDEKATSPSSSPSFSAPSSSSSSVAVGSQCFEYHWERMDDFLCKPFVKSWIEQMIERVSHTTIILASPNNFNHHNGNSNVNKMPLKQENTLKTLLSRTFLNHELPFWLVEGVMADLRAEVASPITANPPSTSPYTNQRIDMKIGRVIVDFVSDYIYMLKATDGARQQILQQQQQQQMPSKSNRTIEERPRYLDSTAFSLLLKGWPARWDHLWDYNSLFVIAKELQQQQEQQEQEQEQEQEQLLQQKDEKKHPQGDESSSSLAKPSRYGKPRSFSYPSSNPDYAQLQQQHQQQQSSQQCWSAIKFERLSVEVLQNAATDERVPKDLVMQGLLTISKEISTMNAKYKDMLKKCAHCGCRKVDGIRRCSAYHMREHSWREDIA